MGRKCKREAHPSGKLCLLKGGTFQLIRKEKKGTRGTEAVDGQDAGHWMEGGELVPKVPISRFS